MQSIGASSQDYLNEILTDDSKETLTSVRRRLQDSNDIFKPGSLNILSAKYESLDYDTCENHLTLDEERKKGYKFLIRKNIARWFIFLIIGMTTALVACAIDISIEQLSELKYGQLSECILLIFKPK